MKYTRVSHFTNNRDHQRIWMMLRNLWIGLICFTLFSCSTIPVEERETVRLEIDKEASQALAAIIEQQPEVEKLVKGSVGYMIASASSIKVPLIGSGGGSAVLYNQERESQTYFDLENYDIGVGFGAVKYQALALFESQEALEKMKDRSWDLQMNNDWSVKKTENLSYGMLDVEGHEVPVYLLSENDGTLTSSARLMRISVNEELTDTAVAEVNLPIKNFKTVGEQTTGAPRQWNRTLPFLGQKVIDEGYDLPLPFGVSVIYSDVFQYMTIEDLEVGFDGSDKRPIDFVSFNDNTSHSQSPQVKLDAWIFPFLNTYASFGKISGDAKVNFALHGDDLIEQSGKDCSSRPKPPVCNFAGKDTPTINVNVDFEGVSYSVGMVLAGGWESYFVAVPITYTYADMKTSDTEGLVFSTMPRVGKLFHLADNRSLALYFGGSYIDSELTISGTHTFTEVEGDVSVDYKIKQSNPDKWSGLFGGSFNIDKHWSWVLEYSGFGGKREQWITSMNYRF